MPRKLRRYDLPIYHSTMPLHQRRLKKAFFFIERLMQINPEFRRNMRELRRLRAVGKISTEESEYRTSELIMGAIEG